MKIERYHLKSDDTLSVFEFISVGSKGAVSKIVHFQPTYTPGLYNLAFGDKHPLTGEIDDLAITNNGDTDKVLATVTQDFFLFGLTDKEFYEFEIGKNYEGFLAQRKFQ